MAIAAGHILKSEKVELQGRIRLETSYKETEARQIQSAPLKAGSEPRQSRIIGIQNQAEFAVIEIACSCGLTTYVKCLYENQLEKIKCDIPK